MLEQDLMKWIETKIGLPVHYQHINSQPGPAFAWFIRNGDDDLDCLDDETGQEPAIVYFDVEIYAVTAIELQTKSRAFRAGRDFRGVLDSGATIEDIAINDQRDDYEPQANAESLPPFMAAFRVTTMCYVPAL